MTVKEGTWYGQTLLCTPQGLWSDTQHPVMGCTVCGWWAGGLLPCFWVFSPTPTLTMPDWAALTLLFPQCPNLVAEHGGAMLMGTHLKHHHACPRAPLPWAASRRAA